MGTARRRTGAVAIQRLVDIVPIRAIAIVVGVLAALIVGYDILRLGGPGIDLAAYLRASDVDPYRLGVGSRDAFVYSPAFLEATWALRQIPYAAAQTIWLGANLVALVALAGPWTLVAVLAPPVTIELAVGNVHLLLAVAVIAGFRWPGAWAFVLFTKPSAGVGLLWFAVRREWRSLGIAVATTAGLGLLSAAMAPDLWLAWIRLLLDNAGTVPDGALLSIPVVPRIVVAAVLVVFGAHRNWRWTVPVACLIALPVIWMGSLAMLVGMIPSIFRGRATPIAFSQRPAVETP